MGDNFVPNPALRTCIQRRFPKFATKRQQPTNESANDALHNWNVSCFDLGNRLVWCDFVYFLSPTYQKESSMARLDTPNHSDDDFDLLYDAESVSDVTCSDGPRRDVSSPDPDSSMRSEHIASSQRLTGPHEVPVMPYATTQFDAPEMTEQMSSSSVTAGGSSSSRPPQRSVSTKSRGNMMTEGLQYTKSMYNKMWNKDALIAVMG